MRRGTEQQIKFDGLHELIRRSEPTERRTVSALAWYGDLLAKNGKVQKADASIRAMADFIDHVWLLERLDDHSFLVRLQSTGTNDLTGEDLTGEVVDPTGHFEPWVPLYHEVLDKNEPVLVRNRLFREGHVYLNTEVLMLPLVNTEDAPTFVLGVFDLLKLDPRAYQGENEGEL